MKRRSLLFALAPLTAQAQRLPSVGPRLQLLPPQSMRGLGRSRVLRVYLPPSY